MKSMYLKSAVIIAFSAILIFFFACIPIGDGGIAVTGTVYEWDNAPAGETSRIYVKVCNTYEESRVAVEHIIANIPNDIEKKTLYDAGVALGYKDAIENEGEERYDYKVYTNLDGSFKESWGTAGLRNQLLLKVTKTGYISLVKEVEFIGANHYAVVAILVRGNNSN